jgi:hypothetical protein
MHGTGSGGQGEAHPRNELEDLVLSGMAASEQLQGHLAVCRERNEYAQQLEHGFQLVAYIARVARPPDELKAQLLRRIQG